MTHTLTLAGRSALLALAVTVFSASAWAEKPEWAGHGRDRQDNRMGERRGRSEHEGRGYAQRQPMVEMRFSEGDRRFVRDYYSAQWQSGHCPPGLAKKGNGCMPPGQLRKWSVGRPLPMDMRRYPLPSDILIRLPMPPAGYEFVRVASDILLIAVGTGMVVDAITDLGR